MANQIKQKVLVVGLPQTGKTTFLAALWAVVGTGEAGGALELEKLDGDQQHLNDLRDLWADCHEIPRTGVAKEKTVSMLLRDGQTKLSSEVFFSDMSGESFEKQWTERVWTSAYEAVAKEATGVLLFIHPERVREAALIRDAQELMKKAVGSGSSKASKTQPETSNEQLASFDPRFSATQVQLVELVQFIRKRRAKDAGFRIGVVISAWDVVTKVEKKTTPNVWLAKRLPLLSQYLLANSDTVPYRIYGVSAQGGDLVDEATRLRKTHSASDRIVIQTEKKTSNDITTPVRWAMGTPEE